MSCAGRDIRASCGARPTLSTDGKNDGNDQDNDQEIQQPRGLPALGNNRVGVGAASAARPVRSRGFARGSGLPRIPPRLSGGPGPTGIRSLAAWTSCLRPVTRASAPRPRCFAGWWNDTTRRSLRPWNRTAARCPPFVQQEFAAQIRRHRGDLPARGSARRAAGQAGGRGGRDPGLADAPHGVALSTGRPAGSAPGRAAGWSRSGWESRSHPTETGSRRSSSRPGP